MAAGSFKLQPSDASQLQKLLDSAGYQASIDG